MTSRVRSPEGPVTERPPTSAGRRRRLRKSGDKRWVCRQRQWLSVVTGFIATLLSPANARRQHPQSGTEMDTTWKKEARTAKDDVATVMAELREMGLSWGEAQASAKDRILWRKIVVALCPTGDEEDK